MISDARGGHVSPGIYTEEKEVTYSVKSLGITNLGLVGEAVKGPAFQVIPIESWSDYTDYFGGTSTEKYKNGLPKYELPYVAKEYLSESKQLQVVRVLGLSGYGAGPAYVIAVAFGDYKMPLVVLRSQMTYDSASAVCVTSKSEISTPVVSSVKIAGYTGASFTSECVEISGEDINYPLSGIVNEIDGYKYIDTESGLTFGKFSIIVKAGEKEYVYNVSLNSNDYDYIYNVIPSNPQTNKNVPIYIESVFDYAYNQKIQDSESGTVVELICEDPEHKAGTTEYANSDYLSPFTCAETPWLVSEVKSASKERIDMKKLFKVYTISDGNAANYQVKISIQNIRPEAGTFDLVVRDFYDTDSAPSVLEKFIGCTLTEGSSNYIGLKVGTYDGSYEQKSKYITLELSTDTEGIAGCVPCGFVGYPVPKYGYERLSMAYNRTLDTSKKTKRQYFGLNSEILDVDIINYKGVDAYYEGALSGITNGFHLDSIIEVLSGASVYVDGEEGIEFTTVSSISDGTRIPRIITEDYMADTIYSDINARKFTVYPYGGFDGWDVFREERTNEDKYKSTKYAITDTCPFQRISDLGEGNAAVDLGLDATAITSDYYAYLAGAKQFANPQDNDINILVTAGINWGDHRLLTEEIIDIVEDSDDGRGGDAIYVMNPPMFDENGNAYDEDDVVALLEDTDIDSSYSCTYFPWIKYFDSTENSFVNLPATKDIVRNMAYTDNNQFPWYSPAGTTRGKVNCTRALKKTTLSSEDTLYNNRINPVKTFAQDGVLIWGNKTLSTTDGPLNRVNVRRLMIRIKKLVVSASKDLIFEQYDDTLEKQFRSIVEPILKNVQENRGISDFKVVTECTAETKDQHILPAKILVKPINSLEYISISFVIYPESVSFDEQ